MRINFQFELWLQLFQRFLQGFHTLIFVLNGLFQFIDNCIRLFFLHFSFYMACAFQLLYGRCDVFFCLGCIGICVCYFDQIIKYCRDGILSQLKTNRLGVWFHLAKNVMSIQVQSLQNLFHWPIVWFQSTFVVNRVVSEFWKSMWNNQITRICKWSRSIVSLSITVYLNMAILQSPVPLQFSHVLITQYLFEDIVGGKLRKKFF